MNNETMQYKILTSMMIKHITYNDINPFYQASKQYILENMEFAKKVYKDVVERFISVAWIPVHAKDLGILKETTIEEQKLKEKDILQALENNKIPPFPKEWMDLKV